MSNLYQKSTLLGNNPRVALSQKLVARVLIDGSEPSQSPECIVSVVYPATKGLFSNVRVLSYNYRGQYPVQLSLFIVGSDRNTTSCSRSNATLSYLVESLLGLASRRSIIESLHGATRSQTRRLSVKKSICTYLLLTLQHVSPFPSKFSYTCQLSLVLSRLADITESRSL